MIFLPSYFLLLLKLMINPSHIAKTLDLIHQKLDLNNPSQLSKFFKTQETLEFYVRCNFLEFEMSEPVERWCKDLCQIKKDFLNWYRYIGFVHGKMGEAFKKWECKNPKIIQIRKDFLTEDSTNKIQSDKKETEWVFL